MGGLIDSACSLWKTDCGFRGACALYDLNRFRLNVHGFPMALRVFVILVLGVAYFKVRNMTSWVKEGLNGEDKSQNESEKEVETSLM